MKRPTKAQAMDFAMWQISGGSSVTLIFPQPCKAFRVWKFRDRIEVIIDRRTLQQAAELAKEDKP